MSSHHEDHQPFPNHIMCDGRWGGGRWELNSSWAGVGNRKNGHQWGDSNNIFLSWWKLWVQSISSCPLSFCSSNGWVHLYPIITLDGDNKWTQTTEGDVSKNHAPSSSPSLSFQVYYHQKRSGLSFRAAGGSDIMQSLPIDRSQEREIIIILCRETKRVLLWSSCPNGG